MTDDERQALRKLASDDQTTAAHRDAINGAIETLAPTVSDLFSEQGPPATIATLLLFAARLTLLCRVKESFGSVDFKDLAADAWRTAEEERTRE